MVFVLFSYKQTAGAGGNNFVARVQTKLQERGIQAEMRHAEDVGVQPGDTKCHPEWFRYWTSQAEAADYVICFDSRNHGYDKSDACRKELVWCQNHKTGHYLRVGGMIDRGADSSEVADYIEEEADTGGCVIM